MLFSPVVSSDDRLEGALGDRLGDRLGDAWRGPRPPGRRSVDSSGRLLPEEAFALPDEHDAVVEAYGL